VWQTLGGEPLACANLNARIPAIPRPLFELGVSQAAPRERLLVHDNRSVVRSIRDGKGMTHSVVLPIGA
jgi:hypothetical protein